MYYQQGGITVDERFARFGSKSYAIDKINSVDVQSSYRKSHGWIGLAIVTVIFAFGALGMAAGGDNFGVAAILALFCGVLTWRSYNRRSSEEHVLLLTTSSQEAQAMKSSDLDEVEALRHAIESAMIAPR